jgi:hypothetical protein
VHIYVLKTDNIQETNLTPTMSFKLVPAVPEDAQTFHNISAVAFATDTHTLMKVHEKGAAGVGGELPPTDEIRAWIEREGKCVVLKAVDDASGAVLGWVGWGLWHYDGSHPMVCSLCVHPHESSTIDSPSSFLGEKRIRASMTPHPGSRSQRRTRPGSSTCPTSAIITLLRWRSSCYR